MTGNTRILVRLMALVVTMGALSWAAVPFYSWFCRVTGFAGTTSVATAAPGQVLDETVRVRFDSNVAPGMGWTFRPLQHDMVLKIGENAIAFYEAINTTDEPITGTASYNVAPDVAGYYFNKIQCFCFTEQTLKPGERFQFGRAQVHLVGEVAARQHAGREHERDDEDRGTGGQQISRRNP